MDIAKIGNTKYMLELTGWSQSRDWNWAYSLGGWTWVLTRELGIQHPLGYSVLVTAICLHEEILYKWGGLYL